MYVVPTYVAASALITGKLSWKQGIHNEFKLRIQNSSWFMTVLRTLL